MQAIIIAVIVTASVTTIFWIAIGKIAYNTLDTETSFFAQRYTEAEVNSL